MARVHGVTLGKREEWPKPRFSWAIPCAIPCAWLWGGGGCSLVQNKRWKGGEIDPKGSQLRLGIRTKCSGGQSGNPARGLAFEGAGGACREFDGVFGAGFFGVLFEG